MCLIFPREPVAVSSPVLLGSVLQEFQLQLSQKGCGATSLCCCVARRQEQLKVVSRAGVAGSLPVEGINLQAAFKVF